MTVPIKFMYVNEEIDLNRLVENSALERFCKVGADSCEAVNNANLN